MSKVKVGVNGFGRIGRAFFRLSQDRTDYEIVAINDLGSIESLAYLLKYDTVYGNSGLQVEVRNDALIVNDREIKFSQERDPLNLGWSDLGIEVVIEATGVFTT